MTKGYWIICKLKPMRQRTVRIKTEKREVRVKGGAVRYRPIPGTGQEKFTQQVIIERAGLKCWIPAKYVYRHSNRYSVIKREKKQVIKSTMGNWAFVAISSDQDLYTLQKTDCVAYVGRRGGVASEKVAMLTDAEMNEHVFSNPDLQDCAAKRDEKFMRTNLEYEVGDSVRVVEGPLVDQIFEVRKIDNDKATVLVDMLGKQQELVVDAFSLAKSG